MATENSNQLARQSVKPLGVLIVDDSEEVRHDLRTILGFAPDLLIVGEAVDGIEAIKKAEELEPDVVLMDLRLPVMDGIQATVEIKRRGLAKGVIMLTIYGQFENRLQAENAGVDRFLEKGVGIEELVSAIQSIGWSIGESNSSTA